MPKEKEETIFNDDVKIKENLSGEEEKSDDDKYTSIGSIDDEYTSIGYGKYKVKGKEDDENADVFVKTDSGLYEKSLDLKGDDKNLYLSFYSSFCTFSLICIPLFYMYVRFHYVKSLMIIRNYNKDWYDDGFIIDGWFKFILQSDKKTWFRACEDLDTSPIGVDIVPYILSFMGLLAIKKIISLLFKIDNRTYSLK